MTELGFRYRPLGTADQEAHAAAVTLLAKDLSHVDPAMLERAAAEWARTERFMPKAVDLLGLIRKMQQPSNKMRIVEENVARGNAHLAEIGRTDCRWVIRDGQSHIETI